MSQAHTHHHYGCACREHYVLDLERRYSRLTLAVAEHNAKMERASRRDLRVEIDFPLQSIATPMECANVEARSPTPQRENVPA